jgi:Putative GTPase activating protein for Arf
MMTPVASAEYSSTGMTMNKKLSNLLGKTENFLCADCGDVRPTWAVLVRPPVGAPPQSPVLGLFCCLHCSAAHRRIENDSCTVKSVKLDQWEDEEILALQRGGNLRINAIFEGTLFDDSIKPTPLVDDTVRDQFIYNKYSQLKYFVVNAYTCVGSEHEDEDEDILDDGRTMSLFSQSAASFSTSTLPSVRDTSLKLSSLRMPSVNENRPSLNNMHRQSSLPCLNIRASAADPCLTPRSTKVSEILALKKIASPFQAERDFWESMNNSKWGDMTFEDSLHRKSANDLQLRDRRSSWGLKSDHSIPTLCSDSECSETSAKVLSRQREIRQKQKRGIPKKAVSERILSTSSKDLPRSSGERKNTNRTAIESNLLLSRPKSARNIRTPTPDESSTHSPNPRMDSNSSRSPSKRSKPKCFPVLDLLEEENKSRKECDLHFKRPERSQSGGFHIKPCQPPPRQRSEPTSSLRKACSLRDVNPRDTNPRLSRTKCLRSTSKRIDYAGEIRSKLENRSLSPKSMRKCLRSSIGSTRTSSQNSWRQGSDEASAASGIQDSTLEQNDMRDRNGPRSESNSDGSSRRFSEPSRSRRRRNASMSFSDHPPPLPPPPTTDTPKSLPSRNRTPKSSKRKISKEDNLRCPVSVPKPSRLERSLSHQILSKGFSTNNHIDDDALLSVCNLEGATKGRPRSLDSNRKNRLRKAKAKEFNTEGCEEVPFQHPLFAYPITMTH